MAYIKTKEDFIEKAKLIHGDKYDYSLVEYKDSKTKVTIKCNACGYVFNQLTKKHLQGQGCKICGKLKSIKKRTKTKEQFIEEANLVHNNKYDYSLVEYKNSDTKVKIICHCKTNGVEHGIFEQLPYAHLGSKQGCSKCGDLSSAQKRTKTTEQFIEKAKLMHGDKYDYSLVEYINNKTKVKIICKEHGEFEQLPTVHFFCGCSKCSKKHNYSNDEFIKLSKDKFKDRFDYSKTMYVNYSTKISLICKKHNLEFKTYPSTHLQNNGGCLECKKELISILLTKDSNEFFAECSKVHNNKYDYSQSVYKGSHEYITYKCSEHGEVNQIAYYHLYGSGCPKCNTSKGEREIEKILKEKSIEFEVQKRYNNLRDKRLLSYDFYVPKFNLLIEYNGEQHYSKEAFGRTYKDFLLQKHHDWLKRKYAVENKINLLIIPYWEFENILTILNKSIIIYI